MVSHQARRVATAKAEVSWSVPTDAEVSVGCGDLQEADALISQAHALLREPAQEDPDAGTADLPMVELASGSARDHHEGRLPRLAGEIALRRANWDRAEELLTKALSHARQNGDAHQLAHVQLLQGERALARRDLPVADERLKAAMRTSRGCPDESCRSFILAAQARLAHVKADSGPASSAELPAGTPSDGAAFGEFATHSHVRGPEGIVVSLTERID